MKFEKSLSSTMVTGHFLYVSFLFSLRHAGADLGSAGGIDAKLQVCKQ
jgi:hypothetical protein